MVGPSLEEGGIAQESRDADIGSPLSVAGGPLRWLVLLVLGTLAASACACRVRDSMRRSAWHMRVAYESIEPYPHDVRSYEEQSRFHLLASRPR